MLQGLVVAYIRKPQRSRICQAFFLYPVQRKRIMKSDFLWRACLLAGPPDRAMAVHPS